MPRLCKLFQIVPASLLLMIGLLLAGARPAAGAGLALPAAPGATTTMCFAYTPNMPGGGATTTLYLTNATTSAVAINGQIYAADGSQAPNAFSATLHNGGSVAVPLAGVLNSAQGVFQTIVTANGPLEGVAHVRDGVTGVTGVYQGVPCSDGGDLLFGPYYGGNGATAATAVRLMNSAAQTATLQAVFLAANGNPVFTKTGITIPPNGSTLLSNATLPAGVTLPADTASVRVTGATAGVHGVLMTTVFGVTTFDGPLATDSVIMAGVQPDAAVFRGAVPRLYVREEVSGTVFSSSVLATSAAAENNAFTMNFIKPDGSQGGPPLTEMLSPGGSWVLNMAGWPNLPSGIFSIVTGSTGPLAIEAKVYPEDLQQGRYWVDGVVVQPAATRLRLPGVVYKDGVFTILAVQNVGAAAASVTVHLRDAEGLIVKQVERQLAAGAALMIDPRDPDGLPLGFFGSADVTSDGPLVGQIDLFSPRRDNVPLTSVQISGPGPFPVQPNTEIQILAEVIPMTATTPITYTWQATGLPDIVHISEDYQDVAPLTWQTPGAKTVKVTAANALGSVTAETEVIVGSAPASVTLSGSALVLLNQPLQLTAAVSPTYAGTPITYTWQATGKLDKFNVTPNLTDEMSFSWSTAGVKNISVTAANRLGQAAAQRTVTVPEVATPTTAGPFVLTLEGAGKRGMTLSVPAAGASIGYTLTARSISAQELISGTEPPEGVTVLEPAVQIEAWDGDGQPAPGFAFDQPAKLILRYTNAEVGMNEIKLRIYTVANGQWLDAADTCDPASTYIRRPEQNEVEVAICHLSPYVLVKEAGATLYLPSIRK